MIKAMVALMLMASVTAWAQDFRGHTWGNTPAQVLAKETMEFLYDVENVYFFTGDVANIPVTLVYEFHDNQLTIGSYMFDASYSNSNRHIEDYLRINEILIRNYGEPMANAVTWTDDLFRQDRTRHGLALSVGHVTYYSEWDTDRTNVKHALSGNNYQISHMTAYFSNQHAELRERIQQETEDAAF